MDIDGGSITILNKESATQISFNEIKDVQLIRLHKTGRVIRVEHSSGILFLSVIRFMIGQFAIINFVTTGTVFKRIQDVLCGEPDPR